MGEPWQPSDATRISDYGSVILPIIGEGDRKRGGGAAKHTVIRPNNEATASSLAHFVEQVPSSDGIRGFGF